MTSTVFNTTVESALRTLVLLVEAYPQPIDAEQIACLDYLIVHTGDIGGPESLHPATPKRSGELVVRRDVIENGLHLLILRGLATRVYLKTGFAYAAADKAGPLVASLSTDYSHRLRDRARWLSTMYDGFDLEDITRVLGPSINQLVDEFTIVNSEEEVRFS